MQWWGLEWRWIFAATFVAALLVVLTNARAGNYPSYGINLNWALGLPCWLTGCDLAERAAHGRLPHSAAIWRWRLAVWGISVVLSILRFHSPVGFPWTLNAFAILVACWLGREISHNRAHEPTRWLEWIGRWSYSLYLFHVPANVIFATFALPNLGVNLNWAVQMAFILGASYAFYLCVELPGHLSAQAVGRALAFP